jgi:opacity protein-like surface antigen
MVSSFSRARASLAAAAIGAFLAPAAHSPMAFAADMPFFTPSPEPVNDQPVEWGTGWYLRGDIGAAHVNVRDIDGSIMWPSFSENWTAGLGAGYQYNNWLRTDVTVGYQNIYNKNSLQNVIVPCQIGAVGTGGPPFTGSAPIFTGCMPLVGSGQSNAITVLANAYFDLGTWWGLTPYIGAGAGVNILDRGSGQINWFKDNLVPYAGTTWIDPFTLATPSVNWDRAFPARVTTRFAYALMAGVVYDLTDHVKIDVGYRWLDLGKLEGRNLFNYAVSKNLQLHQARIGFRYVID